MSEEKRNDDEILTSLIEFMNNDEVERLEDLADDGYGILTQVLNEVMKSGVYVIDEDGKKKQLRDLSGQVIMGLVFAVLFKWGCEIGAEDTKAAYQACGKEG